MIIKYEASLISELASLYASYASMIRGLPIFPVEHWKYVLSSFDLNPDRDIVVTSNADSTSPVSFTWLQVRPELNRAYLRGPYLDPLNSAKKAILDESLSESIKRASGLPIEFIESRSILPEWAEAFEALNFSRYGTYERWRLFPLKGAIEIPKTDSSILLRNWKDLNDLDGIMSLFDEAFSTHWDYVKPDRLKWLELVKSPEFDPRLAIVATSGSAPIGYVFGQKISDPVTKLIDAAYLASIASSKSFRRKGLASAMLAMWLRSVYDSGIRAAELDVDAGNFPAKALYSHFGFKKIRSEDVWRLYINKS